MRYIGSFDRDDRMMEAYKLCWAIQQGLFANDKYTELELPDERRHSGMFQIPGMSMMAIYKNLQYAFILPASEKDCLKALPETKEYQKFFALLGDIDVLNALIFLHSRENPKSFTPNLLVKELAISIEKAELILAELDKYGFLQKQEIELDDETKEVNNFNCAYAFIPMLIFVSEVINNPNSWSWYAN